MGLENVKEEMILGTRMFKEKDVSNGYENIVEEFFLMRLKKKMSCYVFLVLKN